MLFKYNLLKKYTSVLKICFTCDTYKNYLFRRNEINFSCLSRMVWRLSSCWLVLSTFFSSRSSLLSSNCSFFPPAHIFFLPHTSLRLVFFLQFQVFFLQLLVFSFLLGLNFNHIFTSIPTLAVEHSVAFSMLWLNLE